MGNKSPIVLVKRPLLKAEDIRVSDEGEGVRLRVGEAWLDLHYTGALKLSQMLRVHAKNCKRRAGNTAPIFNLYGHLTDAAQGK